MQAQGPRGGLISINVDAGQIPDIGALPPFLGQIAIDIAGFAFGTIKYDCGLHIRLFCDNGIGCVGDVKPIGNLKPNPERRVQEFRPPHQTLFRVVAIQYAINLIQIGIAIGDLSGLGILPRQSLGFLNPFNRSGVSRVDIGFIDRACWKAPLFRLYD